MFYISLFIYNNCTSIPRFPTKLIIIVLPYFFSTVLDWRVGKFKTEFLYSAIIFGTQVCINIYVFIYFGGILKFSAIGTFLFGANCLIWISFNVIRIKRRLRASLHLWMFVHAAQPTSNIKNKRISNIGIFLLKYPVLAAG